MFVDWSILWPKNKLICCLLLIESRGPAAILILSHPRMCEAAWFHHAKKPFLRNQNHDILLILFHGLILQAKRHLLALKAGRYLKWLLRS